MTELTQALNCKRWLCQSLTGVYQYMGEKWGGNAFSYLNGKQQGKANMAGKALIVCSETMNA